MARTKALHVEASIHLRDEDWTVSASYSPGYPARPFANWGEGDPGEPPEIEDVEIAADGHAGVLAYDDLTRDEQLAVDEAITLAVPDGDDDDRAYEQARDDRMFGGDR